MRRYQKRICVIIAVTIVVLLQFGWLLAPRLHLDSDSYRQKERLAARQAFANNQTPELEAAWLNENHLLMAHLKNEAITITILFVAVDVFGTWWIWRRINTSSI